MANALSNARLARKLEAALQTMQRLYGERWPEVGS